MKQTLLVALIALLATTLFAQINPDSGLVVLYHFNNSTVDLSGNGNDATNYGCTFVTDPWGNPNSAAYFSGSAYLLLPQAARFQPLTSHSVTLWIKTTQTSRFDLIDQRTGSGNPSSDNFTVVFNIPGVDDHYSAPHYNPNSNDTRLDIFPPNLENNQWHHLAFVKNCTNDTMYFYYDGVKLNTKYFDDVTFTVSGNLLVGVEYMHTYFYTGALDELRIYNRAISSAEVNTIYLGLNEQSVLEDHFLIYPNPASERITIENNSANDFKNGIVSIYDLQGRLLIEQPMQENKTEVDVSNLKSGIYFLRSRIDEILLTRKIIVE